jgi:hypothetical protein
MRTSCTMNSPRPGPATSSVPASVTRWRDSSSDASGPNASIPRNSAGSSVVRRRRRSPETRGVYVAAERRETAPRIDQHQRRSLRRGEIREDRPRLLCHRLDDAFGASAPVVGHPIEVAEHRGDVSP